MSEEAVAGGRVTRVNGPLVEVGGLESVSMFEVVLVGESRLVGRGRGDPGR